MELVVVVHAGSEQAGRGGQEGLQSVRHEAGAVLLVELPYSMGMMAVRVEGEALLEGGDVAGQGLRGLVDSGGVCCW